MKELVRYCPECGSIGQPTGHISCCPTAEPFMVPKEIAEQAQYGFHKMYGITYRKK